MTSGGPLTLGLSSFEQDLGVPPRGAVRLELRAQELGDAVHYLIPNSRIEVEFHEGKPMGVNLPKTVDLKITETAPGLKSATVTNVLKPATTETGLVVQVPNFIGEGDVIRVDTESGAYLSRAKGE